MNGNYDYGRGGIIGIGTPQANPTVEAEMRILFPANVLLAVARLTSTAAEPLDRLLDYLHGLSGALTQFDTLYPAAFGFGCTGSSYLVTPEAQSALIERLEQRFGYPIVTATDAIAWRLRALGAKKIALASPYPATLADAATTFWRAAGFDVAEVRRIDTGRADTRGIYTLGTRDAKATAEELSALDVDAVLLSGTGMPSLALIAQAGADAESGKGATPVLSSNLCLALRLCDVAGIPAPRLSDWAPRLAEAIAPPAGETAQ